LTVTVNDPVAVFPCPSVAEQVTVVTPSGNVAPDAGEHGIVWIGPETASVADTAYATGAPEAPIADTVIAVGSVSTGGVVSWTRTVKVFCAVFPFESVAVHVTVVVAIGNTEGDAGAQTTGAEAPPAAVAVGGVYVTVAPAALVACAVMFAGVPTIVGAVA
jgi:hypothetical protein